MKRQPARHANLAHLLTAIAIGALLVVDATIQRADAFYTFGIGFIFNSPTTTGRPFLHWDLREFPNGQVPFTFSNRFPDLDGDGNANATDQGIASAVITSSLATWTAVTPAIINLNLQPATPQANQAVRLDGVNVIDWGGGGSDDTADPAPVGTVGIGANEAIIFPGANNILDTAPAVGDGVGVFLDGSTAIHSGADGDIDSVPANDDRWGLGLNVGANTRIIRPGLNGIFDTITFGDDVINGGFITAGPDGIIQTKPNTQIGTAFGLTGIWYNNQTGIIQEADILLQGNAATTIWRAGMQDLINPPPNNIKDIQATITHELGHAIGIAHTNENQLIARGQGAGGLVCINPGIDGVLDAGTIASANAAGNDDQIFGNQVFSGPNGINDTLAVGNDVPAFLMGQGSASFVCVNAGEDMVLTTAAGGDDEIVGTQIGNGANGITESGLTIANIPTMNKLTNPFFASTQQTSLAQDDQDAINFLYTWDLGDADDPFLFGGAFNEYPTKVQSPTNGRMLNGVQLKQPGKGPVHMLGYSRGGTGVFRYEWLGANEDGAANEFTPRDEDMFDDGFKIEGVVPTAIGALGQGFVLNRGGTYDMTVTVSHTNQAGRYVAGNGPQNLQFNGYFDFNADQEFTTAEDLYIFWVGTPTTTSSASADNFVPPAMFEGPPNNRVTVNFRETIPEDADDSKSFLYARMRLDYGEDEGRVMNINGDNAPAQGVAQFGEVEDYLISLSDAPDQLHIGCLPEFQDPGLPTGQTGSLHAFVEREFAGLVNQSVTFKHVAGFGTFNWPDGSLSSVGSTFTALTDFNGEAIAMISDGGFEPGEVLIEVSVAGTSLKAYCRFDTSVSSGLRSSDLNGDGRVDTADLGVLIGAFGTANPIADINGDGVVDTADLGVLLSLF